MEKISQSLLEQFINKQDLRATLSEIRSEIKKTELKQSFALFLEIYKELLLSFLKEEDAKVRKNTALLIKDMQIEEALDPLYEAYINETQQFVKASYLEAMEALSYESFLPKLKLELDSLLNLTNLDTNKKHVQDQIRVLTNMLLKLESPQPHFYYDNQNEKDVILIANRLHGDILLKQVQELENYSLQDSSLINQGVRLKTKEVLPLYQLRTFTELLFFVEGMKIVPNDPEKAARQIADSSLLDFLRESHSGAEPFYFRVEVKSKMELSKKSQFAKKISAYVESFTQRKLINSPGNYEIELRFIENQDGKFHICLKLYTIMDQRFSYRKQVIPVSIKPVNAALLVAIAEPYMIKDARVLDPFCGVGTMLIERQICVKGNTAYGIDLLEDAILKARANTEEAGQIIHFINRDFFDFQHEYLFDEIFTNMPFAIGRKTEEDIEFLYDKFFQKAKFHVTERGRLILYTHNKEYVTFMAKKYGYQIIASFEIMKKEETYLFILEVIPS